MITFAAAIGPVMFVLIGTITSRWTAGVGFFGLALGVTMWNVASMSLRQAMIPAELLGRVLGAHRVTLWGGIPLGALVGGALADRTGVPAIFVVSGIAQLVVVVGIRRVVDRHQQLISDSFAS
jgi:MFS family permease